MNLDKIGANPVCSPQSLPIKGEEKMKKTTIATIKEIKDNENRVGLTPDGAKRLVLSGHEVIVQAGAGLGAGFSDADYLAAGAKIMDNPVDIIQRADILVKVKEPIGAEYHLLDMFQGKVLFTYLHLAAAPKELTEKLLENRITAIAYETVEDGEGNLPLLFPMSQVAGVLATQYGAEYLQKKYGGRGVTLGIIEGAPLAEVVVVGGGTVGTAAARLAAGMGARVTMLEAKDERIRELWEKFLHYENVTIVKSGPGDVEYLKAAVKKADLLVGAVLVPGAKAPIVVTEKMVQSMKPGAVIVDVAIDQGGCVYGSHATMHSNPIFRNENGIIYCCVANMPGQAALQSTQALTNSTLPYLLRLAERGLDALQEDPGFLKGLNAYGGKITYRAVAEDLGMLNQYAAFSG